MADPAPWQSKTTHAPGGPTASLPSAPPEDGTGTPLSLLRLHELPRADWLVTLRADQWKRWQRGQQIRIETYLERFPVLKEDAEMLLDLIFSEVLLRQERGETPKVEEYVQRFPGLRDRLERQFAVFEMLEEDAPPAAKALSQDLAPATRWPGLPTGPEAGTTEALSVPVAVPGYEILGELGRGGMGIVYQARQTKLGRVVALKMILLGGHAGAADLARFRTEAEAIARLQHPNIVQIYEIGDHGGLPFFSLEFCTGGSLERRLRGAPLAPAEAARLAEVLARAMQVAHDKGIIHRDLKPANVLLTEEGTPKVTDFGLAKKLDPENLGHERRGGLTASGAVIGTPSYMAPEQATGRGSAIGPACDVYALGAILYECLTCRPPFKAATLMDTLRQVVVDEPVSVRALQPKVPRDLETICLKCLQKEPRKRYASAAALAEDLRRFQAGEPITARPVRAGERAAKWVRRRPAAAALGAVSAAALVSAAVLLAWHYGDLQDKLTQRTAEVHEARDEAERAKVGAEGEGLLGQAEKAFARGDGREAQTFLTQALDRAGDDARLDDLRRRARQVQGAVELHEKFARLREEALFYTTLYTGLNLADNLRETRRASLEALNLFAVQPDGDAPPAFPPSFTGAQQAEARAGCYELLLLLAQAVAHPLPGRQIPDQAAEALRILDRAARLAPAGKAYHLQRSRYLAQAGDEAGARRERLQADATEPADDVDSFLTAQEWFRQGDLTAATREFDAVLRRRPDHFWARYFLAVCCLRSQPARPAEAKAHLTACLARRDDFLWVYLLRGLAESELGEFDAAAAEFEKALALTPNDTARYAVHVNRAILHLRRKRFDAAAADLREAVRQKPKQYQAYSTLALVYEEQGQLDEAVTQAGKAIEQEPGQASLYRTRAWLHQKRHDDNAALRDLDEAIRLEPADHPSPALAADHVERGRILYRRKDYPGADQAAAAALRLRPTDAAAHALQGEALLRQGRAAAAAAALGEALKWGPPRANVYRARGLAQANLNQFAAAVDDYTRSLELERDSATYNARGWIYLAVMEAPKLAVRDFAEAMRLDDKNGDAFNGRGFARVQLGDYAEAVKDAEEAVRLGAKDERTPYKAARTYAQAVARVRADTRRPPRERQEDEDRFQARAVDLLRQALERVPAAQRAKFWRDNIREDTALRALNASRAFRQLAAEYGKDGQD